MQLFIIFIAIWVVLRMVKEQKQKESDRRQAGAGRAEQGQGNAGAVPSQSALKEKLMQRYGGAADGYGNGDILSRANANVKENDRDMLNGGMQPGKTPKGRKQKRYAAAELSEEMITADGLMDEVRDLMIMGYRDRLTFERDFVSEGIEMLNHYEIPDAMLNQHQY